MNLSQLLSPEQHTVNLYRKVSPMETVHHSTESYLYRIKKINIGKPIRTYSDLNKKTPKYKRNIVTDLIVALYALLTTEYQLIINK